MTASSVCLKFAVVPIRPLTPEDLALFRWVDHARLSPAGDQVAYQVTWADLDGRQNRGHVVVAAVDSDSAGKAVRSEVRRDHSPEWSPGGRRIAFLSRLAARDQLFVASPDGAECDQLTTMADGVLAASWSPDGASLALTARVLSDPEAVVDDPRPPDSDEQSRRPPIARVVRTLAYKRDGVGYFDGRHGHLFVVAAAGGEPRQLTGGPWSIDGFSWSPDGRSIAVIGDDEPDADLRRTNQLCVVDVQSASRRSVASGLDMSAPVWSPRGDLIAFLAPLRDEAGSHERVWIVPADGGEPRCLTRDFDRSVGGTVITDMRAPHGTRLQWSPEGDRVFFMASGPGVAELYSVDLAGRVTVELATENQVVYDFDLRGDAVVACIADPTTPGDVVLARDGERRRLTDSNSWLEERFVSAPERQLFTAADGLELEGWVLKPPGFSPAGKYPLVLQIHGGPHGQYGWTFFHEFQLLAGMGFLVFYTNPRGSDGYGQSFKQACVRDWGGRDYEDLMTALDQFIDRAGYVDTSRMGVAGGSYGGFMTNWIVGHTDRFAAAVSMRSISNLVSEYAQHDIVLWGELEMGPRPWPDPEELWRRSPIKYVRDIRTPLLLLHSEMDLRCAISQAEELFGALRLLGREVELVRFPGESHDLSRGGRPDRRIERLRRIGGWFGKHLQRELAGGGVERAASVS